ncbi:FMN-dependent NADH-azoreductase [Agrobacterium tumefaciens str. Kerr 14]|uniref:FMN dependent NADH:quinone oxidoreductase n=1 Tax=Agrobacterium tumefaciens str. Kerr 14 TaxID=1183424 RepID=A0A1S7S9V6_AGRTU|nr:NAD(P)H-dependent oxidoreductase [Agrobacterium tumefaciens]CUX65214.1 FMN-dependent NADH-azoreductase [Agrobacterium tumefaciens str. Kerr 14]
MTKLLVIETSPRGDASISRNMTRRYLSEWQQLNPLGRVTRRDLAEQALPHVAMPWLTAYFTPPDAHTVEMKDQLALSDLLVQELLETDELVIATPVYNYNIPSALKAWVDHIVRKGLTLGFDGSGLVTGKKATLLIASGGEYGEDSPIRDRDIATQYLKLILKVLGINDVTVVSGGAAKNVDLGHVSMEEFVGRLDMQINEKVFA